MNTMIKEFAERTTPDFLQQDLSTGRWHVRCPLLAQYFREKERFLFVRCPGGGVQRYLYRNGVYAEVTDDQLRGRIRATIEEYRPTAVKMRDVDEVFRILATDETDVSADALNNCENLVNFQNGLLDLRTMEMREHSPEHYMTVQIPCRYDPDAPEPELFNRFLDDLTAGDTQKRQLLLEFMGACLSNIHGYRFKKALFLVGDGDTGKSQLRSLTERLLGGANVCTLDLPELESRFGTSVLFGKRLAGSSDTGFLPVDQMKIFKQLTGGDAVFMERKGKDGFRSVYNGFLWFCMNELPQFGGDRGKWVYERMMIVRCTNVIPKEKQDVFLCEKMMREREGIVRLAIEAVRKVIENGLRFTEPDAAEEEMRAYEQQNSAAVQFYIECCEGWDGTFTEANSARAVRSAFRTWCIENGRRENITPQRFNKEIASFLRLPVEEILQTNGSTRGYKFRLSEQTSDAFLHSAR